MSPKATELIEDLLLSEFGHGKDEATEALKQYIEELERKVAYYETNPANCDTCPNPEIYGN